MAERDQRLLHPGHSIGDFSGKEPNSAVPDQSEALIGGKQLGKERSHDDTVSGVRGLRLP
jgi:hypothetical protein